MAPYRKGVPSSTGSLIMTLAQEISSEGQDNEDPLDELIEAYNQENAEISHIPPTQFLDDFAVDPYGADMAGYAGDSGSGEYAVAGSGGDFPVKSSTWNVYKIYHSLTGRRS